jgi:phospholipid-binding lipoprotein MlaA
MKKSLHACLRVNFIFSLLFFLAACSNIAHKNPDRTSSSQDAQVIRIAHFSEKTNPTDAIKVVNKQDRWEAFNRGVFRVNTGLDAFILKPAAKVYQFITPDLVDTGISNFFANLGDLGNSFNNLLQFKPKDAFNDSMRFVFNSSFGLGGFLDVASEMQFEKHHEDFGQTLAKWGVGSGPYLMLPLLGPSTLRDASARLSVDILTNPVSYHDDAIALFALDQLDKRADLLSAEESLRDLSTDAYSAIRDVWLQRRAYLIRDGKTDEKEQSDLINELESLDE